MPAVAVWKGINESGETANSSGGLPTSAVTRIEMGTVEGDQAQFIEALTPTRLVEELAYLNQRDQRNAYPLWQQMVHVVNHSR